MNDERSSKPYSEVKYKEAVKKVHNRLKKHRSAEIIRECVRRLHEFDRTNIQQFRHYPPWFLLILIKWTLVYGDFKPSKPKKLTPQAFARLINLVHNVDGTQRLPSQYGSVFLFFRSIAYQQFWLQENMASGRLCRQSFLFAHLDPSHSLRSWFQELIGISIEDFIDLTFLLLIKFLTSTQTSVNKHWFSTVEQSFPDGAVEHFLSSLSTTPAGVKKYLQSLEEEKIRTSHEFLERTPLFRFPLLNLNGEYIIYLRYLLHYALQTFVYDTLRRHDPEKFMAKFGPLFEKYVEKGLDHAGTPFVNESTIKSAVGMPSKVVDFFVHADDFNVLIDAKGVEIGHMGMVSHRPDIVTDKAKSSVVRGIVQGVETAKSLSNSKEYGQRDWSREKNFLIVVTFKDLVLGTGRDFYESIAQEKLDRALDGDSASQIIPLEHMYFVSIDEFDWMAQITHSTPETFASILAYSTIQDTSSLQESKRLFIGQHLLNRFPEHALPNYLKDELEIIGDRGEARFQ